jgi:hypothetical protein
MLPSLAAALLQAARPLQLAHIARHIADIVMKECVDQLIAEVRVRVRWGGMCGPLTVQFCAVRRPPMQHCFKLTHSSQHINHLHWYSRLDSFGLTSVKHLCAHCEHFLLLA